MFVYVPRIGNRQAICVFERQVYGDQFGTATVKSWPVALRNGRYLEARAAGQIGVFNTSKFGGPGQPTVTTLRGHSSPAAMWQTELP